MKTVHHLIPEVHYFSHQCLAAVKFIALNPTNFSILEALRLVHSQKPDEFNFPTGLEGLLMPQISHVPECHARWLCQSSAPVSSALLLCLPSQHNLCQPCWPMGLGVHYQRPFPTRLAWDDLWK